MAWHTARLVSVLLGATTELVAASTGASIKFEKFKVEHGKRYADKTEEGLRFANFVASLGTIEEHNSRPERTWEMGLNQFSDMSDEEFQQRVLMAPQHCSATHSPRGNRAPPARDLPDHVDWREKGVISEVKNQGHCGSCWTFATVGCLEAHMAIKYDTWRAPRLSEQQLVDCAQAFDNHGCNGGLPSQAFEYVRAAGGLSTEFHYPYMAKDGTCAFNASGSSLAGGRGGAFMPKSAGIGVQVPGGSVNLTVGDENSLKYHIAATGPVTIAYQVASDFRHYSNGVYSSHVCKSRPQDVNHAVLAMGYGTDPVSGLQYWTIKNSWDYTWGMEGFFKIEAFKNMCGLGDCMAFPDLYGLNAASDAVLAV